MTEQGQKKTALVAGATGLVGGHLLHRLLEDGSYTSVFALSRSGTGQEHAKLRPLVARDFDGLDEVLNGVAASVVFCCLGTTIKKAKSKEAFVKVDHAYPLRLARWARQSGVKRFVLISAMGADPYSNVFYNRVKGHAERDIAALGFPSLVVARPSLILGERKEKRRGEDLLKLLAPVLNRCLIGRWKKYRAIHADRIARAMLEIAEGEFEGTQVYESDDLSALTES